MFKYTIGEFVTIKTLPIREDSNFVNRPQLLILGRLLEECPGGSQRYYRVRVINRGGFVDTNFLAHLLDMREEELVPYPQSESMPGGVKP